MATLKLNVTTNGIVSFLQTTTDDGYTRTMEIKNGVAPNGQPFGKFIRAAIAQAEANGMHVETNFDPATCEFTPGLG